VQIDNFIAEVHRKQKAEKTAVLKQVYFPSKCYIKETEKKTQTTKNQKLQEKK